MYILRNIKNANHIRFLSNLKKMGPISIEGNRCPGVNLIQVVCSEVDALLLIKY